MAAVSKKRLISALALWLIAGGVHAADICYEFLGQGPYSGIRTNTGQSFCEAAVGMLGSPHELGACTGTTGPALEPTGNVTATVTYMGSFNSYAVAFVGPLPIDCPPPDECDVDACPVGTYLSATGGAAEVCNQDCGCKLKKTGMNGGTTTYNNTGEPCGAGDDDAPDDADKDDEKCEAVGDGEYCASPNGDGSCGYLNDSYVCMQKIGGDDCVVAGDSSRICGAGAGTTPPVPDNGTPGQKAAPDGQLASTTVDGEGNETTNIFNYYGSGTVAGSSRDPGTSGQGVSSGVGSSPSEGPSEDQVAEQLGDAPTVPSESHDLASLDDGLVSLSGSCPTAPSVTVFGSSIELTAITYICELADLISGLVLAASLLTAILIIGRGL